MTSIKNYDLYIPCNMQDNDIVEFQALDWNPYHRFDAFENDVYLVQLFGRTMDDKDVCLKIINFKPFFFVKIPEHWGDKEEEKFIDALNRRVEYKADLEGKSIDGWLLSHKKIYKVDFFNFSYNKKEPFLKLSFLSYTAMKMYSSSLTKPLRLNGKNGEEEQFSIYESRIEPHIRLIHINDLTSCGWMYFKKSQATEIPEYSRCDYSYEIDWKYLHPTYNDDRMAPMKIMGYDIECISCDEQFPQSDRLSDAIIQIGMTMYRYGSMQCYEEHIVVLKVCDPIEGATVKCYDTEEELIIGWAKTIASIRPDFIAGYNNFDFDDKYIHGRIKLFDKINNDGNKLLNTVLTILGKVNMKYIMKSERLEEPLSKFVRQELSSSALNDNILYYFQIPGIISIDMIKVIQRDHKLSSYKLDYVSANFISEKIIDVIINKTGKNLKDTSLSAYEDDDLVRVNIITPSTKALEIDFYVQVVIDDTYSLSPLRDGAKYIVKEISDIRLSVFDSAKQRNKRVVYKRITVDITRKELLDLKDAINNPLLFTKWTFAKDDMHHTLINKHFEEGIAKNVKQVAKYCLKDCKLVNLLIAKLDIIVSSIGMASVCSVPFSYIIKRGQGVKTLSLVSKKCRTDGFLIPTLKKVDHKKYDGASVIDPIPDVYLSPIGVLDFRSLYPSSMIEKNLSPECFLKKEMAKRIISQISSSEKKKYHVHTIDIKRSDGKTIKETYNFVQKIVSKELVEKEMASIRESLNKKEFSAIDVISGKKYLDLKDLDILKKQDEDIDGVISHIKKIQDKYDIKIYDADDDEDLIKSLKEKMQDIITKTIRTLDVEDYKKILVDKVKEATKKTYTYEISKYFNIVEGNYVRYGIIPTILVTLLAKRQEVSGKMKTESDPFKRIIYNFQQLAHKITANSVYGNTGASTSAIYFLPIATCTAYIGRMRLYLAKDIVESNFEGAEIIYGDTDSIFMNFHFKTETGEEAIDRDARIKTIEASKAAATLINKSLSSPQQIVYEKVYHPFILVAKKKYVGLLYEDDYDDYELKSMGIVLKRRDNAPIVKIIVGNIVNSILIDKDLGKAIEETRNNLSKMFNSEFPIDKFILSKALKANYKKPLTIAHKVLADRIGERDPGNRPHINDRIPFVYITHNTPKFKKVLQGNVIEHPDFILKNKIQIDYLFYLTNQIFIPASQFLNLMMSEKRVNRFFNNFVERENSRRRGNDNINKYVETIVIKTADLQDDKIQNMRNKSNMAKKLNNNHIRDWVCENPDEDIPVVKTKKKRKAPVKHKKTPLKKWVQVVD